MSVSVEPTVTVWGEAMSWVARFGADHEQWGDPYTGTLTVIRRSDTAHVIAHAGVPITHAERRQLQSILRAHGMTKALFERHRANGSRHVGQHSLGDNSG